jgi:RNA polymerase sigma-70 factor (ECF subfamily)
VSDRESLSAALARMADGDRAALKYFYDATSAKLFGVILRILNDRSEAEDVLQDVTLTIWRKAAEFDASRASPITWAATIARNRAIDRLRARGSRDTRPIEDAFEIADPTPGADIGAEQSEEAQRLDAALGQIDRRAAVAIRSAFFEGVTYQTLAQRAGVPEGTMKSWIRRGLMSLRMQLEA